MSDEWKILIELITGWILRVFSAIAPKMMGRRMGTAPMGAFAGLFHPTFSLTSEYFSSFLTFILYTLSFNPRLSTRSFFEAYLSLNRAYLSLNRAYLSLNRAYLSLNRAYLSLNRAYLSLNRAYLSLNRAYLSLNQAYLSLNRAYLSLTEANHSLHNAH